MEAALDEAADQALRSELWRDLGKISRSGWGNLVVLEDGLNAALRLRAVEEVAGGAEARSQAKVEAFRALLARVIDQDIAVEIKPEEREMLAREDDPARRAEVARLLLLPTGLIATRRLEERRDHIVAVVLRRQGDPREERDRLRNGYERTLRWDIIDGLLKRNREATGGPRQIIIDVNVAARPAIENASYAKTATLSGDSVVEVSAAFRLGDDASMPTRAHNVSAEIALPTDSRKTVEIVAEVTAENAWHSAKHRSFEHVVLRATDGRALHLGAPRSLRIQRPRSGGVNEFDWDEGRVLPPRLWSLRREGGYQYLRVTPTSDGTLTAAWNDSVKVSFLLDVALLTVD